MRLCETDGAARGVGSGGVDGARREEGQGLAQKTSSTAQGDERKCPHAKGSRRVCWSARERWKRMSACVLCCLPVMSRCAFRGEVTSGCVLGNSVLGKMPSMKTGYSSHKPPPFLSSQACKRAACPCPHFLLHAFARWLIYPPTNVSTCMQSSCGIPGVPQAHMLRAHTSLFRSLLRDL